MSQLFNDFQKQEVKFDINKLKSACDEVLQIKGFDTSLGIPHFAAISLNQIPNEPNSIKGKDLKDKLNSFKNINYKKNIEDAIRSIPVKENDIILITGSLYLAGEVLNLN